MSFYYLAGPYSIDPDRMAERHMDAADRMLCAGHVVYSPVLESHAWSKRFPHDHEWWLRRDIEILKESSGVIRLPGESPGSEMEVEEAKNIGLPIWLGESPVDDFIEGRSPTIPAREKGWQFISVCEEAHDVTINARHDDYGHPLYDFSRTTLAIYAHHALKISPLQWPLMMVNVKLSREYHKRKRDNRVDICGYVNTYDMCLEEIDRIGLQRFLDPESDPVEFAVAILKEEQKATNG